jgi:hypothetical protein
MDEQKTWMRQEQPIDAATDAASVPRKRPWQTPDVKMFALDQTEFGPGPGFDGIVGTFFLPPPPS